MCDYINQFIKDACQVINDKVLFQVEIKPDKVRIKQIDNYQFDHDKYDFPDKIVEMEEVNMVV